MFVIENNDEIADQLDHFDENTDEIETRRKEEIWWNAFKIAKNQWTGRQRCRYNQFLNGKLKTEPSEAS